MTLTKAQIVESVQNQISIPKDRSVVLVESLLEIMKKALESTNWNRKKAANLLNISYKSMLNKIKSYEMA